MALIEINKNPSPSQLRRFAYIWFPLFLIFVASAVFRKTQSWAAVEVMGTAAAVAIILGCVRPALTKWIFIGMMYATYPIGWVVSHIVMALIYFLVFTPMGLVMRAFGRDPLNRSFDREVKSYWLLRSGARPATSYLRQF
jgi:ABC-type uncharacterized transport system permease subunit